MKKNTLLYFLTFLLSGLFSLAGQMEPSAVNAMCASGVVQSIDAIRALNADASPAKIISLFHQEYLPLIFKGKDRYNQTDLILLNPNVLDGRAVDIAAVLAFKQDNELQFVIVDSKGRTSFPGQISMSKVQGFLIVYSSMFNSNEPKKP